jgi:hypothetical protein
MAEYYYDRMPSPAALAAAAGVAFVILQAIRKTFKRVSSLSFLTTCLLSS